MQSIQQCRTAYRRAMRIASIRQAVRDAGNAIFVDETESLAANRDHIENRYVITRIAAPTGELVLCNGVRVD